MDKKWEHPCDQALKEYGVMDHKENELKHIRFRMNETLLKSNLEVKHLYKVDPETNEIIAEW